MTATTLFSGASHKRFAGASWGSYGCIRMKHFLQSSYAAFTRVPPSSWCVQPSLLRCALRRPCPAMRHAWIRGQDGVIDTWDFWVNRRRDAQALTCAISSATLSVRGFNSEGSRSTMPRNSSKSMNLQARSAAQPSGQIYETVLVPRCMGRGRHHNSMLCSRARSVVAYSRRVVRPELTRRGWSRRPQTWLQPSRESRCRAAARRSHAGMMQAWRAGSAAICGPRCLCRRFET